MAPGAHILMVVKYAICFALVSALCIVFSPIIIPIIMPLLVIFIGSLLIDAQNTIAFVLKCYHQWNLLKIKYYYKSTPTDVSHTRLITGQAWTEFCDTLKAAQSAISNGPQDALSQAEGYRFLARVTRAGLASFLEYGDPNVPKLHALVGETIKMGADNPDNLYESAPLKSDIIYKLKGIRKTVKYLSIGTQLGHYGKRMGMPPLSFLDSTQFKYVSRIPQHFIDKYQLSDAIDEHDQYFVIIMSKQAHKPSTEILEGNKWNWLRLDDKEDGTLIVRQTFGMRSKEKQAIIRLERFCMDSESGFDEDEKQMVTDNGAQALTPQFVDDALSSASSLVCGAALMFSNWGNRMRSDKAAVNTLPVVADQTVYMKAGGDPNIFYYHSYYELMNDEALIIKALIPSKCLFWNFQLNNHWMESLDWVHFPIHINGDKAKYVCKDKDEEKCVYIVVSHHEYLNKQMFLPLEYRECNVNWLSTAYHHKGTMLFRWLCAEKYQHPTTQLVKLQIHN
eukprot:66613_1